MTNLVSISVKTTGLNPNKHRILSIGAVCWKNSKEFYAEVSHEELFVTKTSGEMNKNILFNNGHGINHTLSDLFYWFSTNYKDPYDLIILGKQPYLSREFLLSPLGNINTPHFSDRCVDIDSILLYLYGDDYDVKMKELESVVEFKMKERTKEHNALHDARWNIYAYEELL